MTKKWKQIYIFDCKGKGHLYFIHLIMSVQHVKQRVAIGFY